MKASLISTCFDYRAIIDRRNWQIDIQKFILLRPYLYHLTDQVNIPGIMAERQLWSSALLARYANVPDLTKFLRTRRVGHFEISKGAFKAKLRNQDPLNKNIVIKNLEGGWTFEDFVFSLNSRVFFWGTESDLRKHYVRYENQNEYPKVLRFKTSEILAINKAKPEFCRLNSGAPRCNSYYKEKAPPRGPKTFLNDLEYLRIPSSIRGITFLQKCILPETIWISNHPDKKYHKYEN